MTLISGIAASLAVLLLRGGRGLAARRVPADAISNGDRPSGPTRRLAPLVVAACIGATMLVLVVGVVGALVAVVTVALLLATRLRRESSQSPDCALTIDLLAGCLAAGAAMPHAINAAVMAAPDALRGQLSTVARALATGAPPAEAWSVVLHMSGSMSSAARVCTRGIGSGAAIAAELHGIAARDRRRRRADRQQRINRASVWVVLPLGLCFLPAFVLVGVVPLVVGLLPTVR